MARKKKEEAGLTVKVEVVGTSATAATKTAKLPKSGAALSEILEAVGVSGKNKDLTVNGKPATLQTHVGAKDSVSVQAKAKEVKVQVSERPAGS